MLYVVATPIGNLGDITLRARECLANCDFLIGEERRVASTLLKKIGLEQKEIYELNEHTRPDDMRELVELCASNKSVALISDCGTPGFQDPGPELIRQCRARGIEITTLPGASSLMAILSLASQPVKEFVFVGFLSAEKNARSLQIQELKSEKRSWVVMDTPYRLESLMQDLALALPKDRALLTLDLTQETEKIMEASLAELATRTKGVKAEFMLLKYSNPAPSAKK